MPRYKITHVVSGENSGRVTQEVTLVSDTAAVQKARGIVRSLRRKKVFEGVLSVEGLDHEFSADFILNTRI